jgi:hypothetical protein
MTNTVFIQDGLIGRPTANRIAGATRSPALRTIPALLIVASAFSAPVDARILFNDVTLDAGVDDTGETYGTAVGDINGDGCPDVWIDHHQYTPTVILRNRCDGTMAFEQVIEEPNGSDASAALGNYYILTDTHGVGFADFDNDGDQDIMEVSGASYYNLFWVNDGLGNFTESDRALGFIWPIDTNTPQLCTQPSTMPTDRASRPHVVRLRPRRQVGRDDHGARQLQCL